MRAAHVCAECHVADPQHVLGPAGAHGCQVGAALTSSGTLGQARGSMEVAEFPKHMDGGL